MRRLFPALAWLGLSGCAGLTGDEFAVYDPHEAANRVVYDVVDTVDRHTLSPVARGY